MSTVDELARDMCVDPGDVLDVWEEEGVLSPLIGQDLRHVLSPAGERHIPEFYLRQPGWREFEAAEEKWWARFEER